ncbi:MFS transporter [Neobacillus mesonae]|uniref:MFS transporter n=1 Tax=Neobacillus mesonae TaxID=1193713 RepID=UPI00203ADFE0|nr:MFS transporter [Neobacillus mesonae]MCM3568946.1 MFS transporter [Neobacillus mesonae]
MKIIYIVCITGVYMLMIMGTRPTVSLFAHDLGGSINQIGVITSLFSIFPLIFAIILGKIVDQLNSKVTLLAGGYLGVLGIIMPSFLPNFYGLYLSQLIAGSAQTIFMLSAQDYVGRISTSKNRNQFVSWLSLGIAAGTLLGPLFSGIIADYFDFPKTFMVLAIVGLLNCIFIHFIPNEYPVKKKIHSNSSPANKTTFLDLLKIPGLRVALLFSSLILFAKDLYITFFPLLGVHFGYSNSTIGLLLAINGIASVIIRFSLSPLIARFGSIHVFIGSMIVTCVTYLALPFFSQIVIAGIIAFILGIGLGIGQPLSISLTIDNALKGRVAEALGIRLTVNRLTQVTTPIVFGAVANVIGLIYIFIISSTVVAIGTGIASKINGGSKSKVSGVRPTGLARK